MKRPVTSRRRFLQIAGLAGAALGVPALAGGYALWEAAGGELPPALSPYFTRPAWTPGSPAAPVLILTVPGAANVFGPYLAEVLAAEGLSAFVLATLDGVAAADLAQFPLVVLAEGALAEAQVALLTQYVTAGGRLVAMRPDAGLAAALGLEVEARETAEAYLQIAADSRWASAMTAQAVQFHGVARHYQPGPAEVAAWRAVAWLATAEAATERPAVLWRPMGQGQAAVWAFDLAHSLALTRQGNPAWANQARVSRDGNVRAQDMFLDWIDLDRLPIPQADEHQRLFGRVLTEMLSDALPLPRLWYFPGAAEAVLVATGDSHQNPARVLEEVLGRVEQRGGRMTIYYTPPSDGDWRRAVRRGRDLAAGLPVVGDVIGTDLPTPARIADWVRRGHEFGLHPYVEDGLEAGWRRYWQEFTGLGYGPVPPSVRTHRILWTGWVETAWTQAAHGIRMNLDYYHYGALFQKPDGAWGEGYLTGSGLPMRFVDEQGRVLNIFQQHTHLVDEHLMEIMWGGGWAGLTAEDAVALSRLTLERALQPGQWAAIGVQFHLDPFAAGGEWAEKFGRWLEGTLDIARDLNIPIFSAVEWLTFVEARDAARFTELAWSGDRLTFTLAAPAAEGVELTVMAPAQAAGRTLTELRVDGQPAPFSPRTIAGVAYGWTTVAAGDHSVEAIYA